MQPPVDETYLSVRFKHGIHTIYLFIDAMGSVADVSKELLSLLRERYPNGLTASLDPPETTPIPPEGQEPTLAFGVLNIPNDPTRGWKRLKYEDEKKIAAEKAGMKQNGIVAFTFLDDPDDEAVFKVEWPRDEDETYDVNA